MKYNVSNRFSKSRKEDCIAFLEKFAHQYTADELATKLDISDTTVRRWCSNFTKNKPKKNTKRKFGYQFKGDELKKRQRAIEYLRKESSKHTYLELSDMLGYSTPVIRYICKQNGFPIPMHKAETRIVGKQESCKLEYKPNLDLLVNKLLCAKTGLII